MSTYETSNDSVESDSEEPERGYEQSLLEPEAGDVVIELHRESGFPIMFPLRGDWQRMLEENVEDWVYALRVHNRMHFDSFVVAVYGPFGWQRRATWSEAGVRWLK